MVYVMYQHVSHDYVHDNLIDDLWYCILLSWEDLGPSYIGIDFVLLNSITSEIINPLI